MISNTKEAQPSIAAMVDEARGRIEDNIAMRFDCDVIDITVVFTACYKLADRENYVVEINQ